MRERQAVRVLRVTAFLGAAFPLAWLVRGIVTSDLGPEPVDTIQHWTGLPALSFLWLSLAVSPMRRVWGLNGLVRLRRFQRSRFSRNVRVPPLYERLQDSRQQ